MNYHPKGMQMWDAWYWKEGETVHAFHLQCLRPNSERTAREANGIGHAVSCNLVDWTEKPLAIGPGEEGSLDDMGLFTGCTYGKDGKNYIFYTMRCSADEGRIQRLGAAVSTDEGLEHWEKLKENPLIVPDPAYYCSPRQPGPYGIVDCRDLCIVKAPDKNGFYGFFASRQPSEEMPEGAVIACCYSEDLLHWEQLPPAFFAHTFTIVEVPEVFEMDGKWYMLLLCNNEYGNREIFPQEPRLTMGTIYAVADSPCGPYRLQEDYILMASEHYNGISCRTLLFEGERIVLYTSVDRAAPYDSAMPCMGVLSTPKKLELRDGKLRMIYSPLIETAIGECILNAKTPVHTGALPYQTAGKWSRQDGKITGRVKTAWARYDFDAAGRSFLYRTHVTIQKGTGAGVVFKATDNGYGGCVFLLDAEAGEVQFLRLPNLEVLDTRKLPLEYGRTYEVLVVSKEQYVEMYVDEVLMIQCVHYAYREGYFGLIADRSEAEFEGTEAYELRCPREDED